ncbi:hypothetical protein STEG23_015147, partial [Scotinomys teguina]
MPSCIPVWECACVKITYKARDDSLTAASPKPIQKWLNSPDTYGYVPMALFQGEFGDNYALHPLIFYNNRCNVGSHDTVGTLKQHFSELSSFDSFMMLIEFHHFLCTNWQRVG